MSKFYHEEGDVRIERDENDAYVIGPDGEIHWDFPLEWTDDQISEAVRFSQSSYEMAISITGGIPEELELVSGQRDRIAVEAERLEKELEKATAWINDLQSGMYVNCIYCGHRYGPNDGTTPISMADVLKEHAEQCSKHPMSILKTELEELKKKDPKVQN